jgi:hypothetical protein
MLFQTEPAVTENSITVSVPVQAKVVAPLRDKYWFPILTINPTACVPAGGVIGKSVRLTVSTMYLNVKEIVLAVSWAIVIAPPVLFVFAEI